MAVLDFALWKILRLLHPFMPFATEELAHQMGFLKDGESVMYAPFPHGAEASPEAAAVKALVEAKFELVRAGRNLRVSYEIAPGKKLDYYVKPPTKAPRPSCSPRRRT
jgi:valyl-tRNA synthetase